MNLPEQLDRAPLKVAIIGPDDLVRKTLALQPQFPTLRLMGSSYAEDVEAPRVFVGVEEAADMALFTGPASYHRVMAERRPALPALYVPYSTAWLYPTLFEVREKYDLRRVSIDTFSREAIEEAYRELRTSTRNVFSKDSPGLPRREELVKFHLDLYRRGETTVALSCLRSAYVELSRLGVPCLSVVPTSSAIREVLERAYLIGENLRFKETQTVAGLVNLDDFKAAVDRAQSAYDVQRLRLQVHQALLRYVEEIDGHLIFSGGDEYQFFTTRGLFEKSTRSYTAAPLVREIRDSLAITISLGVGFGMTANQAGINARVALQKAKEAGGNACYVLLENKRLIGPLGPEPSPSYELRMVEPQLLARAEAAGLSMVAFSRLLNFASAMGRDTFTANELAPVAGVTLRSTHRLLNRLVASGQARVVGEERLTTRGRPRQLYKLLMLEGGDSDNRRGST